MMPAVYMFGEVTLVRTAIWTKHARKWFFSRMLSYMYNEVPTSAAAVLAIRTPVHTALVYRAVVVALGMVRNGTYGSGIIWSLQMLGQLRGMPF